MMKSVIGRVLVGLLIVAAFSLVVVATVGVGVLGWGAPDGGDKPTAIVRPSPVCVKQVELASIEITDSYSGMIRPMERFSLGFEIAGRVEVLGTGADGEPLDEGHRVTAGQVLAKLEEDILEARLREAQARNKQALDNLDRGERLKGRQAGAISETEYQSLLTEVALTAARLDVAKENLEDATLTSPVGGVIARRLINVGESVNPQQTVFEVLQVDDVLLVVGVPEAFVGEIRRGQPVHVELLARDRFRRKRPELEGPVWRVAEAADDTTGLFEIEVLIDNPDGRLKPGLIGLAHIVVDRIQGFRVPLTSAVFRDDKTLLFSVGEDRKAHGFELEHWIEQGPDLILSELPPEHRTLVVRGQHRLVEGRAVEVVQLDDETPVERAPEAPVQTATRESTP